MKKPLPLELEALLDYFPIIAPPLTLSEEVAYKFSAKNKPLPQELIANVFARWDEFDEYTELVPCCQLPFEEDFYAIIYWKGALLSYEYILATLDKEGTMIAKKVIAGTLSNGQTIKSSVATIDEDACIYSMVGEVDANATNNYTPSKSSAYKFEILPDGHIHTSKEDIISK